MSVYGPGFESSPVPPLGQPPSPTRPHRSRRAWLGGAAVLAAIAGAIGGFVAASASGTPQASAASSPSSTSTTTPHPGKLGPRGVFPGGNVVHGTYTARTPSGSYQTYDVQVGKASNVNSSSITVTSDDGYVHTYPVTASTIVDAQRDGIGSVSSGDQVRLIATVSGNTATATDIVDTTKVAPGPASPGGFVRGPGGALFPGPAA